MNTSEGRPSKSVNERAIEEIQDYDNTAIREMLEHAELARPGDAITAEDYEATKSRATVLARESGVLASAEALIFSAFVSRMKLVEKLGDEEIKKIPNEALRSITYVDTGYKPTDEELEMLRKSPLSLEQWVEGRTTAQEKIGAEFDVAMDKEDTVISRGTSPEEALRNARDERGQQM